MAEFSIRKFFGKGVNFSEASNLVGVQKKSYSDFLQMYEKEKKDQGLQSILKEVLNISDANLRNHIEFISYTLEEPEFTQEECVARGKTYSSALRVNLRLTRYEGKGSEKIVKEIQEQNIFLADMPLICENGAFVINGTYRTIVSQLHKSPGVFFDVEDFKNQGLKKIHAAHIVPHRGAWLDFVIDQKGLAWVRVDKKRKILLSTFLMLLNLEEKHEIFSKQDILNTFYEKMIYKKCKHGWKFEFSHDLFKSLRLPYSIYDHKTGELLQEAGKTLTTRKLKQLEECGSFCITSETLIGFYLANEIKIGEELFSAGLEIDENILSKLETIEKVECLSIDHNRVGSSLRDTVLADKNETLEDALLSFYKILRPGEIPSAESAAVMFKSMFFDLDRYDLSAVGRVRMNSRLAQFYEKNHESDARVLSKSDFIAIVKGLLHAKDNNLPADNIDHLSSRRIRSVGELVANQSRMAMFKISKSLKEKLNSFEMEETLDLCSLLNTKVLASSLREFFGTSQLSQIMDNLNPLAKLAHDRRVTAMGRGGVVASRAGDTMRDVGESYYGRICPVETPEGQNIGLISYLSVHARIDDHGFIQTPYRKVEKGIITNEIVYLNAQDEERYKIAPFHVNFDKNGKILDTVVPCRIAGGYSQVACEEIEFIDVSSGQILSAGSSLVPFINHDDPGRALMGANMMRQALPLKFTEAPFVGTGLEKQVAIDSMACVLAKNSGKVIQLDSTKIIIQQENELDKIDTYLLKKYNRSNSYSCINQKPIVNLGDVVKAGQIIASGQSIAGEELALGRNLRVAFMSLQGYTFEDAIVISKDLVDKLTSIRIEELEVAVREDEEITRSIPGVSDEFLNGLDETGVVYLGSKVKPGDVLVGKVAPKVETTISPEERLLKAMFGEKAANVVDASLRVPPGCEGIVINVQISSKKGAEKDERTLLVERIEMQKLIKDKDLEIANLTANYRNIVMDLLENEIISENSDLFPEDAKLEKQFFEGIKLEQFLGLKITNEKKSKKIAKLAVEYNSAKKIILEKFEIVLNKLQAGDILPVGISKVIRIFVAMNRVIEEGDKLAGRHGNKGVISKIMPVEDMPFDEDGNRVDIVLNPLGVAARMNIGQIFETNLGWISKEIGIQVNKMLADVYNSYKKIIDLKFLLKKVYGSEIDSKTDEELIDIALKIKDGANFAVPAFDGIDLSQIKELLKEWNLPVSGKLKLRDGQTGEYFDRPITVGYMYILKLNHMVADKVHARSTGAYSLITQQPPGGRAKMGGQRKGEMEIWALQAYGASYITKESMTIKSDDHDGRVMAYESITKGQEVFSENNTPEGFKVLTQELRSILLNIEPLNKLSDEVGERWVPSASNFEFDALKISLMGPEQVKKLSFGEVKKAETLNYRTQKAEIGGLHCPAIFGPEKDYRCACGRYAKMKYRGIICEKCGVEVTVSRVRRERMGHIELATPVAHVWFTKVLPSSIGMMLDLTSKDLDKVLRFESYIVVDNGISLLKRGQLLTPDKLSEKKAEFGRDSFKALIGAEGIEAMLKSINLEEEKLKIIEQLQQHPSEVVRKKLIKKLKMINGFIENKIRPEWMIIRNLPVLPADLRPLVALDGGRFATPDSNELYRRIINRNNRLKILEELGFPEIVKQNEKRMIATAVEALIDNARLDKPFVASNGRPLQSISDILKGKQGRFRQNLLGKRVDYSGRSVIVVGPKLRLHQCGLPRKMALELFKPFVYARLEQYGFAMTLKSAKRIVEEQRPEVWEILKEVVYQHPVLLNRPPTLHRLGIQAFECVLVDSNAIQLHPLVCAAFNADFDGDQMSVHVPLSVEAQTEARILMMAPNNMISPANGSPIMAPKKDMVLGLYYLTNMLPKAYGEGLYLDENCVEEAVEQKKIHLNSKINVFVNCRVKGSGYIETTAGRVILYHNLPLDHKMPFERINKLIAGSGSSVLFEEIYNTCSRQNAIEFADILMTLGFKYATKSGISFGLEDIIDLPIKEKLVKEASQEVDEYQRQYKDGLITERESKSQITSAWSKCDDKLGKEMEKELAKLNSEGNLNSLYMMYNSGARGSTAQMRQIMTMRGFVAKTTGELMENAVTKSYKEGLTALDYFIATHGTRKGFADLALKTADAGYFTRKLVDVAQDCIITSHDCYEKGDISSLEKHFTGFNERYITFEGVDANGDFDFSGAYGRILAEDVKRPDSDSTLIHAGQMLEKEHLQLLKDNLVIKIKIRSPITCLNEFGICSMCYGMDLSKGKLVSPGEAVGVIAAQSIGEPGAQLTMRTFHSGGGAKHAASESLIKAVSKGVVHFRNAKFANRADGTCVMIGRYCEYYIIDSFGRVRGQSRIPYGAKVYVQEGQKINQGDLICEWDSNIIPRLAPVDAIVEYVDLIEGVSLRRLLDDSTGSISRIVSDWKRTSSKRGNIIPALKFKDKAGNALLDDDNLPFIYKLESDDVIMVDDGAFVEKGDLIIKKQKVASRSSDITADLSRLIELFEARAPKLQAVISEIDGVVAFGKDYRFKRSILVIPNDGSSNREYMISKDVNLLVQAGDPIRKGDPISEGDYSLHDILKVLGKEALVLHLLHYVQLIFKTQGMNVNNKHFECIIRYMLRKVEILDAKNSAYVNGEQLGYVDFLKSISMYKDIENIPNARPILQGITRAASMDKSYLKSASFQEPHKVLINACLMNPIDHMQGVKEALITGRLMPIGTGFVIKQWQQSEQKN